MNLRGFLQKLNTSARWRLFNPKIPVIRLFGGELSRLGSSYGGKTAATSLLGDNSVVISAGAGEDLSFEIELEVRSGCQMYILDPTPAAIAHYEEISRRGNAARILSYLQGPRQSIDAYDTQNLEFSKIKFIAKALWKSESELKFYPPLNDQRDGSYSLSSLQNNYRKNSEFMVVTSTTIPILVDEENLNNVDFLKLDIEGAALEVLRETFSKKVFPTQINLELDEMHFPGPKSYFRSWRLNRLLHSNSYECIHRENCDFLFIRKNRAE